MTARSGASPHALAGREQAIWCYPDPLILRAGYTCLHLLRIRPRVSPACHRAVTDPQAAALSEGAGAAVCTCTTMHHLQVVPDPVTRPARARPVTVVSPESREVVYVEDDATIEIIKAALTAWGLRVRAERGQAAIADAPAVPPADAQPAWETTRPGHHAPGRLENELSPLWLPIRLPIRGNEPVTAFAWFSRAA